MYNMGKKKVKIKQFIIVFLSFGWWLLSLKKFNEATEISARYVVILYIWETAVHFITFRQPTLKTALRVACYACQKKLKNSCIYPSSIWSYRQGTPQYIYMAPSRRKKVFFLAIFKWRRRQQPTISFLLFILRKFIKMVYILTKLADKCHILLRMKQKVKNSIILVQTMEMAWLIQLGLCGQRL